MPGRVVVNLPDTPERGVAGDWRDGHSALHHIFPRDEACSGSYVAWWSQPLPWRPCWPTPGSFSALTAPAGCWGLVVRYQFNMLALHGFNAFSEAVREDALTARGSGPAMAMINAGRLAEQPIKPTG